MKRKSPPTILAPVDFSAASPPIIETAAALARSLGARLLVLNVVQPPGQGATGDFGRLADAYAAAAAEAAEQRLEEIQRRLGRTVAVETLHLVGNPAECIVGVAARVSPEYIVMGSHGAGGLRELVMGSTATRVLRQATCPVVVVPLPGPSSRQKTAARTRRR